MRLALLLIPYLMRALVYIGIILVATPLRTVLSVLPNPERGQRQMTNTTTEEVLASYPGQRDSYAGEVTEAEMMADLKEWAQTAKTAIEELIKELRQTFDADSIAEALESAAALRKRLADAERDAESNRTRGLAIASELERASAVYQEQNAVLQRQLIELEQKVREQRDRAGMLEADRDQQAGFLTQYEGEINDLQARADALEVEVVMLEEHVEAIEESDGMDCWAGWDDGAP